METSLGQLLEALPLPQRLLRYRQFSQDALQKASEIADADMRAGYLSIAAGWHMLATEIERITSRRQGQDEFSSAPEVDEAPHRPLPQ